MISLSKIPKVLLLALFGSLLIVALIIAAILSGASQGPEVSIIEQNGKEQSLVKFTINDIESLIIHSGLDIQCPNLKGVSQHGYVYSVVLKGKEAVLERMGCGTGEPEVFAAAIAQDLELNGNFETLPLDQLLEKMTFKFYDLDEG